MNIFLQVSANPEWIPALSVTIRILVFVVIPGTFEPDIADIAI